MEVIFALGIMLISVIMLIISTLATLLIGIAIANHFALSGITWWAFIIFFWIVTTSILRKLND